MYVLKYENVNLIYYFYFFSLQSRLFSITGLSLFLCRYLFDRMALRNVDDRNFLFTVSLGFSQPLGPIVSALFDPFFASSIRASTASLF